MYLFSQAIYWATIFVSVYNLVLIAYERFLAICQPLKHERFSENKLKMVLLIVYMYSFTLGQAGSYFHVRYSNSKCLPEYYFTSMDFKKVMFGYAIFTFNQFYTLPMIFFICKLFHHSTLELSYVEKLTWDDFYYIN